MSKAKDPVPPRDKRRRYRTCRLTTLFFVCVCAHCLEKNVFHKIDERNGAKILKLEKVVQAREGRAVIIKDNIVKMGQTSLDERFTIPKDELVGYDTIRMTVDVSFSGKKPPRRIARDNFLVIEEYDVFSVMDKEVSLQRETQYREEQEINPDGFPTIICDRSEGKIWGHQVDIRLVAHNIPKTDYQVVMYAYLLSADSQKRRDESSKE